MDLRRGERHLQGTGRDARGRKQYRYHPRWRRTRDETKYEHMLDFGRSLPAIRRKRYIHPAVLEGYLNGSLRRTLAAVGQEETPAQMWRIERIVMRFPADQAGG